MRAMASAILFFILNMIGLGLGPVIVGLLSDSFVELFGDNNLRYAMICALLMGLSGTACFVMAARNLLPDLQKQSG
jgi:MFS family permease